MYFRQILHDDLGCASYLLADGGEAVVVDPKWEIDEYLTAARGAGARILHVIETHNHADHVSGRRRLATASGAQLTKLSDGDTLEIGDVEIRAIATPGHRPEHVAYVVSDGTRSPGEPWMLLAGDSLLVGDLARPDLAVSAREGAAALWSTIRRLEELGDHVELWPGHVGGSLCGGGSLSAKTSSTIGYERRANPLLTLQDSGAFVEELTRCTPARPPVVERVVALNLDGAPEPPPVRELSYEALFAPGTCIVDVRSPELFDAGHLAGALNIPGNARGLGTRAGWAVGLDEQIVVVAADLGEGERVVARLQAAGLLNVAGVAVADPAGWAAAGLEVRTGASISPEQLLGRGDLVLLDVRDGAEWGAGHLPDSLHLPLSELGDGRGASLPTDRPLAVACAAGGRAAIAASILRRRGHSVVWRVKGGIGDVAALVAAGR